MAGSSTRGLAHIVQLSKGDHEQRLRYDFKSGGSRREGE